MYHPSHASGGYLLDSGELVGPSSSCLDFAFGMPEALDESPYPEKIVIAFLRKFTQGPLFGGQYLTDQADDARQDDPHGYWAFFDPGTPFPYVCIKELGYSPDFETQAQVEALEQGVGQVTANVDTRITLSNDQQQKQEIRATWQMLKQDNVWKIDRLVSVRPVE